MGTVGLSSVVKWLGHYNDDHLPLSRAEVKEWGYTSTPPNAFRAYMRSNLPLYF
jgi:protease II